jgi:hypothetical protein
MSEMRTTETQINMKCKKKIMLIGGELALYEIGLVEIVLRFRFT